MSFLVVPFWLWKYLRVQSSNAGQSLSWSVLFPRNCQHCSSLSDSPPLTLYQIYTMSGLTLLNFSGQNCSLLSTLYTCSIKWLPQKHIVGQGLAMCTLSWDLPEKANFWKQWKGAGTILAKPCKSVARSFHVAENPRQHTHPQGAMPKYSEPTKVGYYLITANLKVCMTSWNWQYQIPKMMQICFLTYLPSKARSPFQAIFVPVIEGNILLSWA